TEGVDVWHGVQREPPGLLGGAVAEPERHDAVADLVQDDRDNKTAEVEQRLFVDVHEASCALAALRRAADAQPGGRHRLEAGLADALVAQLAFAVAAVGELGQGVLDLLERLPELAGQRLDLAS